MTYRQAPLEPYQQKIAELEDEITRLKTPRVSEEEKTFKESSPIAKMAVMITVVLAAFIMVSYYVGIVRTLMILWQIIMYVIAGVALTVSLVTLWPYMFFTNLRKK
jgi:F0F1-type ATP synthase assembly protein I